MVKTFFTDPYILLFCGALFSILGIRENKPILRQKSFWLGLVEGVVVTLLALFFYIVNPEWMWMYVVHESNTPFWLGPSLLILYPFPYIASYTLSIELGNWKKSAMRVWFLFVSLWAIFMHALIFDRWTSWVTAEEYIMGAPGPFLQPPLNTYLYSSIIVALITAIILLYLANRATKKI